jgi:hypothetical protein
MVQSAGILAQKDEKLRDYSRPGVALRRALAQFNGLLTTGSNRKIPRTESIFYRVSGKVCRPEGIALMIRQLITPLVPAFRRNFRSAALAVAVVTFHAGQVLAQGAFPAPLPGKAGTANDPAFPPVNGAAPPTAFGNAPPMAPAFGNVPAPASFPGAGGSPMGNSPFAARPTQGGPPDDCMREFLPLRQEAEKRGQALKAASDKHQGPDVACKLIGNFIQAEVKMIKYVEVNSARCGIPPQIFEQLKKGHKGTESMQEKVCNAATQAQKQGPVGPSLSDVLGSATALPEATSVKKSSGSTFDTLSGNALTRGAETH